MSRYIATGLALILGVVAVGLYLSAFIVHQNEQVIVLQFGKPVGVIQQPGLNWKVPVVQTVEFFDKRILDLDMAPQEVPATDQKLIVVDAFARYRINDPLRFYQTLFDQRFVVSRFGPIVESTLRRVLGTASFLDIVRDKREPLMQEIARQVNAQGQQFGIEVVDVRIKRADLPENNLKSVYDRMKAARRQEAEEFRAQGRAAANKIRADAERQATVIRAEAYRTSETLRGEGDAERNRIFAEAYNQDAEFATFYRSMQSYETALKSGETRLVLSPTSEYFRYFNNPNGTMTGGGGASDASPRR
jgi:membrane protease subunit HflC